MWPNRRGLTLLDTLAAIFVMAIASSLLAGFLIFSLRQSRRYDQRQEQLLKVEKALLRILSGYSISRFSYYRSDSSIAGALIPVPWTETSNVSQYDSQGKLLWSGWRAIGWDSKTGTLWESYQKFNQAVTEGGELSQGPSSPAKDWKRTALVNQVVEFELSQGSGGSLKVRILSRDSQGYQIEMSSSGVAQN